MASNKSKVNNRTILPKLSVKDEDVPSGYIGIYELFVLSPDVRKLYGEKTAQDLRVKTYKNVLDLYYQYGSQSYDKFWNYHVEMITSMGLNEFAKFEQLKEVCDYVECFVKTITYNGNKRRNVSFGISFEKLKVYKKEKEEWLKREEEEKDRCFDNGIEYVPSKFFPPIFKKKNRGVDKDIIDFGAAKVQVWDEEGKDLDYCYIGRGCIYKRFEKWRLANNYSKQEAYKLALKEVVDNNPVEGIGELEDYNVVTIFDKEYLTHRRGGYEDKNICIRFDGQTHSKADEIIHRLNLDPQNQAHEKMTISKYAEEAVKRMNKSMPLKYSNPEEWENYIKLKEFQEGGEIDG